MAVTRRVALSRAKKRGSRVKARARMSRRRGMVGRRPRPRRLPLLRYRNLNPFPKSLICRHKYVDTVTCPAGGAPGVVQQYLFRANGLFDPDYTGTGHQPMYRDELAARYSNYIVLDSYITLVTDQTAIQSKWYGMVLDDDIGGVQTDPTTVVEQYGGTGPLLVSNRNKPLKLKKSFSAAREFNTTVRALMADDTAKTPVNNDPTSDKVRRFFTCWCAPQNATLTGAAERWSVSITYVVAWLDPTDATQS